MAFVFMPLILLSKSLKSILKYKICENVELREIIE